MRRMWCQVMLHRPYLVLDPMTLYRGLTNRFAYTPRQRNSRAVACFCHVRLPGWTNIRES